MNPLNWLLIPLPAMLLQALKGDYESCPNRTGRTVGIWKQPIRYRVNLVLATESLHMMALPCLVCCRLPPQQWRYLLKKDTVSISWSDVTSMRDKGLLVNCCLGGKRICLYQERTGHVWDGQCCLTTGETFHIPGPEKEKKNLRET